MDRGQTSLADVLIEYTAVPLRYGCVALMLFSAGDRQDVLPAPSAPGRRRWGKNSHLWETCACQECTARRAGQVGAGYGGGAS